MSSEKLAKYSLIRDDKFIDDENNRKIAIFWTATTFWKAVYVAGVVFDYVTNEVKLTLILP